jgi:hypothetical protein
MSKRTINELESFDDDVEDLDLKEIVKEKKLKKKTTTATQAETVDGDGAGTSGTSTIFDEIMTFDDDPTDKFQKTIQISSTEGIGVNSNNISLLRITKKNGKPEISNFQFTIKNSVIPNLIMALRKVMRFNAEKKK